MDSLPPWPVVQSMLLTVVLPGLAVGTGLLAGVCAATRSETARMIGGALALAGGLALGNFTRGLFRWWSLEVGWPSLFPATLAALGGGVVAAILSARLGWHWGLGLRLITAAGCAWWLTPANPPLSRLGFFILIFAGGALDGDMFRRHKVQSLEPIALLALVIPWGLAAATVLIHAHSARFCDMAVLLTATFAGVALVASVRKLDVATIFAGPAIFLPALMLGGAANTFSEVPLASFILLALIPCLLWSLCLPPMRHWSGRTLVTAAAMAVLAPCTVAVILAMRAETLEF